MFMIPFREAGAIILKLSYGYNIKPEGEDPLIILQSIQQERFSLASQPGTWIVDILPFSKREKECLLLDAIRTFPSETLT